MPDLGDPSGWSSIFTFMNSTSGVDAVSQASTASDGGSLWWALALQVLLIALNAIFACAEIAVISTNENKLERLSEEGNKKARRLLKVTKQPARFLATIQVAITLSGFLGSAFAADKFAEPITQLIPIPHSVAVILVTLILSYITLVLGELVPKRIAMKKSESISLKISGLISFVATIFRPIVWLLTVSTNGVLRLLGIDPNQDDDQVSEEEIRMMVDVGNEKGVIDAEEKEMIQNVFEFDDISVSEISTHRTDIEFLWKEDSMEEWDKVIKASNHAMYPICADTTDTVIGVLNAKRYLRLDDKSIENVMENAVKDAYFVPETMRADVLFKHMKKTRNHFAIVLDEYGGVVGVVTMNDLLEQLVGDFDDEDGDDEKEPDEIEKIDENTWKIRGIAPIKDVCEELDIELPDEEYDTFGGLVFGVYGIIPNDGATFEIDIDPLHIKVTEVREHRIEMTTVCINKSAVDDEKQETEKE